MITISSSRPSSSLHRRLLCATVLIIFGLLLSAGPLSLAAAEQQQATRVGGSLNNATLPASTVPKRRRTTAVTIPPSLSSRRSVSETPNATTITTNTTTTTTKEQEDGPDYDCSECPITDAILFPWFVELMGCVILFILVQYNIPIPYAACMFILGAAMGTGASLRLAPNALSQSILLWSNIDSAVLLLIFLPGLIFKDAVEINFNLFSVAIWQLWILSFPMVLMGTFLVAFAGIHIMPYGWKLGASATLGAILSSTDPIAVASVLKTSGASPRLVMHIQGESLLNDGSAFVFFTIFSQMYYYDLGLPNIEQIGVGEGFALFFQMSLGGIAVGICFGFGLLGIIYELDRRLEKEFDILQVVAGLSVAYLAYWVCDQILTMSGVVACVSVGMVVNALGRGMINDEKSFGQYLALAEFLLNTLLFTLGGVVWGNVSFEDKQSYQIQLYDWGWLMVLYLVVLVFRFLQVGTFYPALSRIGLKSNPKEAIFLAYGGLRGAVGVALGLSLVRYVIDNTDDYESYEARKSATILQFMGGGVTLLTLTINGTSAGWILKKLGLAKPAISKERERIVFEGAAKDFVYGQLEELYQDPRFHFIDFDVLKKHVPFITNEPPRVSVETCGEGGGMSRYSVINDYRSHTNQVFNQRVASNGDQYMRVIDVTRRASEDLGKITSEKNAKQQLLIELRIVFLELLAEAYNLQLEMGELDEKDDDLYIHDVLIHSVDLASNDVEHENKPIEDWKYLRMFHSFGEGGRLSESIEMNVSDSLLMRISVASSVASLSSTTSADVNRKKKRIRRLRKDVIGAIAFKEGHAMAETKLRLYVNRLDESSEEVLKNMIQPALEEVLEESRKQVLKANEMLEENIEDNYLDLLMSHYSARILLHRLIMFTERKFEDGLLSKLEARKYMTDFDSRIRGVMESAMDRAIQQSETPNGGGNLRSVDEGLPEGHASHQDDQVDGSQVQLEEHVEL